MIKRYKIPEWHQLYSDYFRYIKNRKRTREFVIKFAKDHKLYSGLIQVGTKTVMKFKKGRYVEENVPYFMINDNNPKILEHDLKILGTTALKRRNDGYYPLRVNSDEMRDWIKLLKDHDNFVILDPPEIKQYICCIDENGKDFGDIVRKFEAQGDDLYLIVECNEDFIAVDAFIEQEEN